MEAHDPAGPRGPRARHHRHRHRLRPPVLRREPPRGRERSGGLRGRGHEPLGARPPRRARGEGPPARGGGLRDRDPRPPRPRGRGGRDDAAAAEGPPRRPSPRGAAHGRPVEALGRRVGRVRRGVRAPQLRRARPRRRVPGRRGPGRLHARAGRPAAPLPRHAGPRPAPLLRLGRGVAVDVHRRHLRPLVPRARERAGRLHLAYDDAGAVRAGGPPRLDRPAGRPRAGGDAPHPLLARRRDRAGWPPTSAADGRARGARARAADGKPDRAARLRAGVEELFLGWVRDHGTPLRRESVRGSSWPWTSS